MKQNKEKLSFRGSSVSDSLRPIHFHHNSYFTSPKKSSIFNIKGKLSSKYVKIAQLCYCLRVDFENKIYFSKLVKT